MKRLLNTLFVMTQGAYLAKEGEAVLVRVEGATKARFPIHNLGGIVCFGNVGCSPFLMGHCAGNNVAITFLSEHGRFLAKAVGKTSGNVLLRREQYRRTDDPEAAAAIARNIVAAKVANCRAVLSRAVRDHGDKMDGARVSQAVSRLSRIGQQVLSGAPLERTRGLEGEAANAYFAVLGELVTVNRDAFDFEQRTRRPPLNRMNALLSFFYVLLAHDVESALEAVGLDPQVGFLHRECPGRASLALDLMEELRPVVADRLALTLVNRQQVKPGGFTVQDGGAVLMDDATRRSVLKAYQERKRDELRHPYLDDKVQIGMVPFTQALLLARHLRGDCEQYPPFMWR